VIQAVETLRRKWDSVMNRGKDSLCAVGENFRRRGIVSVGDGKETKDLSGAKDIVIVCVVGRRAVEQAVVWQWVVGGGRRSISDWPAAS
jgi:hypothetical protein